MTFLSSSASAKNIERAGPCGAASEKPPSDRLGPFQGLVGWWPPQGRSLKEGRPDTGNAGEVGQKRALPATGPRQEKGGRQAAWPGVPGRKPSKNAAARFGRRNEAGRRCQEGGRGRPGTRPASRLLRGGYTRGGSTRPGWIFRPRAFAETRSRCPSTWRYAYLRRLRAPR